jgi:Fe-S cluster assembly iron-binding protein IscA
LNILLTDAAAEKAKEFLGRSGRVDEKGNPLCGLRLQFKGSDVMGVKYAFSVDCNAPRENDNVVESHGFRLYVDSGTYAYLAELTETLRIDHVETPEYSGFRISFPQRTITLEREEKLIPQAIGIRSRKRLTAVLIIVVLLAGLTAGWLGGSMSTASKTSTQLGSAKVVSLDVIPDWGGPTYDAFVVPANTNGTIPKPGTNSIKPGPNDNNITAPVNTPVTFVITDLDTALNLNFTGNATIPFTFYNDTATGQVPVRFSAGEKIVNLTVSHSFVVAGTNVDIPLPPDTIVTFTVTFTKPGAYLYFCTVPCGLGMGLVGYMEGYIIVG